MMNRRPHFITIVVLVTASIYSTAFITSRTLRPHGSIPHLGHRTPDPSFLFTSSNSNNGEGESSKSSNSSSIDQNLQRPPINIRKESILFSENPTTAQNNNIAQLWQFFKNNLPYIFTGVSKDENDKLSAAVDKNPIGAIYNMVFVRCPSVMAGVVYSKNLLEGHGLYCDVGFGSGPFEIAPLFVYGVLLIILR